jgi:hypothetical protein
MHSDQQCAKLRGDNNNSNVASTLFGNPNNQISPTEKNCVTKTAAFQYWHPIGHDLHS